MTEIRTEFDPGVLTGSDVKDVFALAKARGFALPAANCTGSNTMNGVMEAAAALNSPVIIQFSHSGSAFIAGKGIGGGDRASILGSLAGAAHVNTLAAAYGARVILHTDHCAKDKLGWVDGLLEVGEKHFAEHGRPLFSSHMLDLSEEPLEENVATCRRYLERTSAIGMTLEVELGITGGEEDGVDNTAADQDDLVLQAGGGRLRLRAVHGGQRSLHDRRRLRQRARRVQAGQRPAAPGDPPAQPGVHRREVRHRAQAGRLRVPRRVRFRAGEDRRGDRLRRGQDEHRHRPAVGAVGRHPRLRVGVPRLSCRARSATPRAPTSRTRSSTTRACGCVAARTPSSSASSKPSPN